MADPWAQFKDAEEAPTAVSADSWAQFADAPGTATLTAYEPSIRDRIAGALMPDNPRESPVQALLVESLMGSRGLGRSGIAAADFVPPVGALLMGDEASRASQKGDFAGAALNVLGVMGPGAVAARAVPALEAPAAMKLLPPPPAAVVEAAPAAAVEAAPAAVAEAAPAQTGKPFANLIRQPKAEPPPPEALPSPSNAIRAVDETPVAGSNAEQVAAGDVQASATAIATPKAAPAASNPPVKIVTPDQSMEIAARPQIVELDELQKATGSFQPRDRTRAEYAQEARERAARLDPAQLGVSRVSDSGAPIVLGDGTIISGNGRTMSIAEAYSNPALKAQADAYRASLGPEAAGMRQPVMVMRAEGLEGDEAVRFADLSNRGRIASMSATERAGRDAKALGDTVGLYQGGDFEAAHNSEFVRQFMEKVATRTERAAMSKDGVLTQEGAARMRNAVLASAYDDAATLSRMLESTDDNVRSLTGALTDVAPKFSTLKADIRAGLVMPEMDATPQITDAVKLIADLRSRRVRPADFFAQKDAFGGTDPITEGFVRAFYNDDLARPLSREKLTAVLNAYADEAAKHRPGGLFLDETTTKDVLNVAQRAKFAPIEAESAGQAGLFDPAASHGARLPEGGPAVSGREASVGSAGPGGGGGDGKVLGKGLKEIEGQRQTRKAAIEAYRAATGKPPPKEWPISRITKELQARAS